MTPLCKREVVRGAGGRVLLVDSITQLDVADAGSIVVSASHGGVSSAAFALQVPLALAVFNDAGVGKDDAGIAGLAVLQRHGVAGAAVAHSSARIGDAQDTWEHGIVSHVNDAARATGLRPGEPLRELLTGMVRGAR